jgi:hypothetical protein
MHHVTFAAFNKANTGWFKYKMPSEVYLNQNTWTSEASRLTLTIRYDSMRPDYPQLSPPIAR